MKNLAALTVMAARARGLASSSTVTAAVAAKSGTETSEGLTGLAAVADNPAFRLTLTGPIPTTVTTGPRDLASANGACR